MKPFFQDWGFFRRLSSLIVIMLLLTLIFVVVSLGLAILIYGQKQVNAMEVQVLQFTQGVLSFGMFILPSALFAYLFENHNIFKGLSMSEKPKLIHIGICILMFFVSIPLISYLEEINLKMQLPQWMSGIEQWMRTHEEQAKIATEKLLGEPGINALISNIIVIALIPAIGEELLFRATLQKNIFQNSTKIQPYISVIIVAILFSTFHLQFYGFLPRFVLGTMLGLLFLLTKNIWVPISYHFINNFIAVMVSHTDANETVHAEPQFIAHPLIIILSLLATISIIYLLYKTEKKH
ncbi:MAG: CPBP family intramembrane metalloprotease [Bacteroidales bacterium]|jgi:hypothetical protein|nr:CPBP family intramembrane metalloprotease [Bacteroidales bacterium]